MEAEKTNDGGDARVQADLGKKEGVAYKKIYRLSQSPWDFNSYVHLRRMCE